MIDRCANGWNAANGSEKTPNIASDHCVSHLKWNSSVVPFWSHSSVLQLGGLAQVRGMKETRGVASEARDEPITTQGFEGCIAKLRINHLVSLPQDIYILSAIRNVRGSSTVNNQVYCPNNKRSSL